MRAAILAIALALLSAPDAAACSMQEKTTEEQKFAMAKEVFLARIVRVEESAKPERIGNTEIKTVTGTYKLLEVFKGEPRDGDPVTDFVFTPGNCSLGIMAGLFYVFFIRPDNRLVLWVNGSRGYINLEGSVPKADFARFREYARKSPGR
jgi:hypothetical protein